MKRLAFLLSLLVAGCAQQKSSFDVYFDAANEKEKNLMANNIAVAEEAGKRVDALIDALSTTKKDKCIIDGWSNVNQSLAKLSAVVDERYGKLKSQEPYYSGASSRQHVLRVSVR
ncbi:MAG TPA: hypothetical protein VK196_04125 [Magnetospirillum sp.]|nr:hypothetical protein [Magnetospirillum sp.]